MTEPTAFERLLDSLDGVRRNGNHATARCPAHKDHNPSLSIAKIEGRVLVYCHGGCAIEAVLDASGLAKRDLFDDPHGVSYRYDDGRTVYRTPSKKFRQAAAPKGASTLYRLAGVREAVAAGTTVYLVEGEQDVHAMESLSVVATTAPMGARNFRKVDASPLFGGNIVVIPDLDDAGQNWARQVLDALDGKVDSLRFMAPKIGKDAADHVAAGYGLGDFVPGEPPLEPLEEAEPDVLPGPGNPMGVARVIIRDHQSDDGELTLRHWRGGWMQWRRTHWVEAEEKAIKSWAYGRLERARYWDATGALTLWNPNRRKVGDVLDALAAVAHTAEAIDTPSWLDSVRDGPQDQSSYRATEIVACSDGLLHVGTRKLLELTPLFYNRVAVPFAYDATAPQPTRWLAFLDQLWPDDPEPIAALQEFFGYVLSGRTDLHKILLLIGPTRSGKGTIARVLSALLGKGNVAGPTLASLGTNFGLSPLLGKPLAVVSDARLAGGNVHQVVERLLSLGIGTVRRVEGVG
jgi:D5 N terminal like